jgi:hypothetical protein
VLWIVIGPPPDHPEYVQWWKGRMVSVEQAQAAGQAVLWADAPPVPLPGEEKEEPKKPRKRKKG